MLSSTAPNPLFSFAARLLALVALLGFGILPNGVMPHLGKDGTIELVLCTGDGPVTMLLDADTGQAEHKAPTDTAKPACDWSMANSHSMGLGETSTASPPETLGHRANPTLATNLWRPAHDPRGLYARGPPSLI